MNEPANRLPSMFPYVWLPTFLVQAALFGHLLVFEGCVRAPVSFDARIDGFGWSMGRKARVPMLT